MRTPTALLLIAFCASIFAQTDRRFVLPLLETTRVFALGPVGFAASTSQQELEFKQILALPYPTAIDQMEKLYATGNPQAMSYALAGMRKLDRKRYAELLVSVRASDVTVQTMSGCIISKERLRKIADDLDSGKYDAWLQ
jgi:hypothetical protein